MTSKRVIEREISFKEFEKESEGKHKYFIIKYKEWNNIIRQTREYKDKSKVYRILNSPATTDVKFFISEMVDDG